MLSFTSHLSTNSTAFVIFVTEKYVYGDKRDILPADTVKKINSFVFLNLLPKEYLLLHPQYQGFV